MHLPNTSSPDSEQLDFQLVNSNDSAAENQFLFDSSFSLDSIEPTLFDNRLNPTSIQSNPLDLNPSTQSPNLVDSQACLHKNNYSHQLVTSNETTANSNLPTTCFQTSKSKKYQKYNKLKQFSNSYEMEKFLDDSQLPMDLAIVKSQKEKCTICRDNDPVIKHKMQRHTHNCTNGQCRNRASNNNRQCFAVLTCLENGYIILQQTDAHLAPTIKLVERTRPKIKCVVAQSGGISGIGIGAQSSVISGIGAQNSVFYGIGSRLGGISGIAIGAQSGVISSIGIGAQSGIVPGIVIGGQNNEISGIGVAQGFSLGSITQSGISTGVRANYGIFPDSSSLQSVIGAGAVAQGGVISDIEVQSGLISSTDEEKGFDLVQSFKDMFNRSWSWLNKSEDQNEGFLMHRFANENDLIDFIKQNEIPVELMSEIKKLESCVSCSNGSKSHQMEVQLFKCKNYQCKNERSCFFATKCLIENDFKLYESYLHEDHNEIDSDEK